jgi:hypothetical protein
MQITDYRDAFVVTDNGAGMTPAAKDLPDGAQIELVTTK